MPVQLTEKQAQRFFLLKSGKWRDYPLRTTEAKRTDVRK